MKISLMKILPHFDTNQKRRHQDYIGLYLGFLAFAATGAKVKYSMYWKKKKNQYLPECLKFTYSEKATKLCEIFSLLLNVCTVLKSKVKISQNFVAFSEYMNFNNLTFEELATHFSHSNMRMIVL